MCVALGHWGGLTMALLVEVFVLGTTNVVMFYGA